MRTVATLVVMFLLASPAMAAPMKVDPEQYQTAQSQAFSNPVFVFEAGNLPAQRQGVGLAWGLSKQVQTQWQMSKPVKAAPVPEPGALVLMAAMLLMLVALRRTRLAAARS